MWTWGLSDIISFSFSICQLFVTPWTATSQASVHHPTPNLLNMSHWSGDVINKSHLLTNAFSSTFLYFPTSWSQIGQYLHIRWLVWVFNWHLILQMFRTDFNTRDRIWISLLSRNIGASALHGSKAFNSIAVLRFLYSQTLTSMHDNGKNPQSTLDGPLLAKWCLCLQYLSSWFHEFSTEILKVTFMLYWYVVEHHPPSFPLSWVRSWYGMAHGSLIEQNYGLYVIRLVSVLWLNFYYFIFTRSHCNAAGSSISHFWCDFLLQLLNC